jgi:hypothetical protein
MKKQTAFQWYMEQHNIIVRLYDNISVEERFDRFQDIIKKTQEMEKQHIKDAWLNGVQNWDSETDFEDYYNETFNTK